MNDLFENPSLFDETQPDIVEMGSEKDLTVPDSYDFISEDVHPEVVYGTYPGQIYGYRMSIIYAGREINWKSVDNGIRGRANCNITVDSKGRAYIISL